VRPITPNNVRLLAGLIVVTVVHVALFFGAFFAGGLVALRRLGSPDNFNDVNQSVFALGGIFGLVLGKVVIALLRTLGPSEPL
jgi:ABC-type uncharacterized transport system permease subunit